MPGVKNESRRSFVSGSGVALAAASFLNLNPLAKGANERIIFALVGGHNQGRGVARRMIEADGIVKTICDLDEDVIRKITPEIAKAQDRPAGSVRDYDRVLEDRDIDAVLIVTPDHWHTHMADSGCGPEIQARDADGHSDAQLGARQQRDGVPLPLNSARSV
jgi:hypothetical protein